MVLFGKIDERLIGIAFLKQTQTPAEVPSIFLSNSDSETCSYYFLNMIISK